MHTHIFAYIKKQNTGGKYKTVCYCSQYRGKGSSTPPLPPTLGLAERCYTQPASGSPEQSMPGLVCFQFLSCDELLNTTWSLCLVDTFPPIYFHLCAAQVSGLSFLYSIATLGTSTYYLPEHFITSLHTISNTCSYIHT